jgi:pilus assembly protein CpaE
MSSTLSQDANTLGSNVLPVALIGPTDTLRKAIATDLAELKSSQSRQFTCYPSLDEVPRLLEGEFDVIIIELDSNPEHALDLVEAICSSSAATVMVYAERAYPEMLVRCMQAGAREYLTQPITRNTLAEAMIRASVRRPALRPVKKAIGKLISFFGAKGGCGVTTVASNFAVSIARESDKSVLLIDLNLPFGDAALEMGLISRYSTANALQSADRLDANFLSTLLSKHSSGLFVLAAPDRYTDMQVSDAAVESLLNVARQEFDFVVVDAGSRFGMTSKMLLEVSSSVYLVVQVNVSELRNANRLIAELFRASGNKLEIVLNRFTPRVVGIDDDGITKALTMQVKWKIPSDYRAAQTAQNTAVPLAMEDSPISLVIKQMARTACSLPAVAEKKTRFALFG